MKGSSAGLRVLFASAAAAVAMGAGSVAAEAATLPVVGGHSSDPGVVGGVTNTVAHATNTVTHATNLDPADVTRQANSVVALAIDKHDQGDTWDRDCGCWRHHHHEGGDDHHSNHKDPKKDPPAGGNGGGAPALANTGTPIAGGLAGVLLSALSGGFLFWRRMHA